jgi:hypothetical protein
MMLRTRNCLPHSILSLIKSIDQVTLGSLGITRGFLPLQVNVSSIGFVSHSALPGTPCKSSCGSIPYPHVSVLNIFSRSHHQTRRQHGLPLQLGVIFLLSIVEVGAMDFPSACTPESCLYRILPLSRMPVPSLPRVLEFFSMTSFRIFVVESKVSIHLF